MPNTTSCLAATRIYLFYECTPPTLCRLELGGHAVAETPTGVALLYIVRTSSFKSFYHSITQSRLSSDPPLEYPAYSISAESKLLYRTGFRCGCIFRFGFRHKSPDIRCSWREGCNYLHPKSLHSGLLPLLLDSPIGFRNRPEK